MAIEPKRVLTHTLLYGVVSCILYYLLYRFDTLILEYSKQGGWYFIVPLIIAFTFSIVHGNFTGRFWDLFGIKPKSTKK